MSTKRKFCMECGMPSASLTAKFCEDCGHPFGNNVRAAVPTPTPEPEQTRQRPQRPQRRRVEEVEADDNTDDDDSGPDTSYVPEIDELEVDIQVDTRREKIGNLAGTSRSEFQRPPDKVPKGKKAFNEQFLSDWQKEAGTARKKK